MNLTMLVDGQLELPVDHISELTAFDGVNLPHIVPLVINDLQGFRAVLVALTQEYNEIYNRPGRTSNDMAIKQLYINDALTWFTGTATNRSNLLLDQLIGYLTTEGNGRMFAQANPDIEYYKGNRTIRALYSQHDSLINLTQQFNSIDDIIMNLMPAGQRTCIIPKPNGPRYLRLPGTQEMRQAGLLK